MTERFRTTISVSPEVHEIFKHMADAANMSVSRCMGDWLADTADAANMITLKMQEAKRAPMRVMRELKAMVAGMASEVDSDMDKVRKAALSEIAQPGAVRPSKKAPKEPPLPAYPPSCNTGVLVPPLPPKRSSNPRSKKL
jgi:hypothetical protein